MLGSPQPETPFPPRKEATTGLPSAAPNSGRTLDGHELKAALQLLVERAQYITGATGAALALAHGDEMVCHASTGSSGPAVGARLQVRSGLSGESIARKRLLRCDNAETDPRVNLETCRQLGIASIVVLPLLTRTGEVRGLFELFSDHAYAFEERDLVALERMADLTLTALDLAEERGSPVFAPAAASAPVEVAETSTNQAQAPPSIPEEMPFSKVAEPVVLPVEQPPAPAVAPQVTEELAPAQPAPVPEAMRRVQKCSACGFPVSEGRRLCLDCERKSYGQPGSTEAVPPEFVPAFLASTPPPDESWLANHVNLLALLVLIMSIVVAVVVFR